MDRDLRQTELYREIEQYFQRVNAPAYGRISGAANPAPSPDGQRIAFTGSKRERLEGLPVMRICLADVATGAMEELTAGPNDDLLPCWSPDGARLAFLSDRKQRGQHQLYLLEAERIGEAVAAPTVDGTVESLAWSPDGRSILLTVAGAGADLAGGQGSGTTASAPQELPSWAPEVDGGVAESQWRRAWVYDVAMRAVRPTSQVEVNVWEATWAGSDHLLAIVSREPSENAWYTAPLALIETTTGRERVIYECDRQLGLPAASPSGRRLAVVRAVCSDRQVVAGDLLMFDHAEAGATSAPTVVSTQDVDVTYLAWRDEDNLFFAGLRGLRTVYGEYNAATGQVRELWASDESSGQRYPLAAPLTDGSDACALVLQSYTRYPELAIVRDGQLRTVARLAHEGSAFLASIAGRLEEIRWTAPDGLEIEGLLALPDGPGPHPLIVDVHGGPVWAYRNMWAMSQMTPLLVSRGYAVLHPNPRGSSGRGQEFAERVYGDMGGADTQDILAGVDSLVERGVVDTHRVGVTGGSYGGYMSSWIITQTDRFAASVPFSPVTDWVSQHYTSNIGYFDQIFLQDDPANAEGRYSTRSPITYAGRVRTPTLQTAGKLDRCTPAGQAEEFHRALLEHGVASELALYPEEGHGVAHFPAVIDFCARVVGWFERHMPARQ